MYDPRMQLSGGRHKKVCTLIHLWSFFFSFFFSSLEGKGEATGAGMFSMTITPSSTTLGKLGSGGGRSEVLGIFLL